MDIDNSKIKYLTKLAVYDKHYGEKDRKAMDFFKGDYIYLKNAVNRFGVYICLLILLILKFCHQIVVEGISVDEIDYISQLQEYAFFAIVTVIVYTVIGTYIYSTEYDDILRRVKKYNHMLDKLNELRASDGEDK